METVLKLFKLDLGISHDLRDALFLPLLKACESELRRRGVELDLKNPEDQILLSDYAIWSYRHRTENVSLAQNLSWRIRNRIVQGRANRA